MRPIKSFALILFIAGFLVAIFNGDTALAVDGAVQAENFIKNIVKALVGMAGVVAVIFMVIGGYFYITSSGHPEKLDKAKRTLLYSAIGLVIVLAAYVIVDFVAGIAKSSFGS